MPIAAKSSSGEVTTSPASATDASSSRFIASCTRLADSGCSFGIVRRLQREHLSVPRDRPLEAVTETGPRAEPDGPRRMAGVEASPRLPVRLGRIPHDAAFETGQSRDEFDEVLDRNLRGAPQVDRFALV